MMSSAWIVSIEYLRRVAPDELDEFAGSEK